MSRNKDKNIGGTGIFSGAKDFLETLWQLDKAQKADTYTPSDNPEQRDPLVYEQNRVRKRQTTDEDDPAFSQYYQSGQLLEPAYSPATLIRIFEESDILQAGIRARVNNIERPHQFEYCGPAQEKESEQNQKDLRKLTDFFSQVNEKDSWLTLRRKARVDGEISIGEFLEMLRDEETGDVDLAYHVPATYMRVTPLDEEYVKTWAFLPRDGELKLTVIERQFRRFARSLPNGKIQWFKEFGDPRVLDQDTGKYVKDKAGNYILEWDVDTVNKKRKYLKYDYKDGTEAHEIWWFRETYGGQVYPTPRWVCAIPEVRGRYLASWVNYDTLDHGGSPPWLLFIFGRIAKGTRDYLTKLVKNWRNPNVYSEPGIIEIEPNLLSFNPQGGGAKAGVEFQSMREMRNEESMFQSYRKDTQQTVGSVLGIAPILYGVSDGSGGTNYAALETVEMQTFDPARGSRDERVNVELIQAEFGIYNWHIKTKGAPIGDKEALYKALGMAGRTGGPSLNQLMMMENEVFGTQWVPRNHPFYDKISAAEAVALARNGMVIYEEVMDGDKVIDYVPKIIAAPTMAPAGNILAGLSGDGGVTDGVSPEDATAVKSDLDEDIHKLMSVASTINLFKAMQEVEKEVTGYKPRTVKEADSFI